MSVIVWVDFTLSGVSSLLILLLKVSFTHTSSVPASCPRGRLKSWGSGKDTVQKPQATQDPVGAPQELPPDATPRGSDPQEPPPRTTALAPRAWRFLSTLSWNDDVAVSAVTSEVKCGRKQRFPCGDIHGVQRSRASINLVFTR